MVVPVMPACTLASTSGTTLYQWGPTVETIVCAVMLRMLDRADVFLTCRARCCQFRVRLETIPIPTTKPQKSSTLHVHTRVAPLHCRFEAKQQALLPLTTCLALAAPEIWRRNWRPYPGQYATALFVIALYLHAFTHPPPPPLFMPVAVFGTSPWRL